MRPGRTFYIATAGQLNEKYQILLNRYLILLALKCRITPMPPWLSDIYGKTKKEMLLRRPNRRWREWQRQSQPPKPENRNPKTETNHKFKNSNIKNICGINILK